VKPRVLCDTNILVSAFIAGGPPSRVVESAIDGRIELLIASPVIEELERVLTTKLGLDSKRVREITALLNELASSQLLPPATAPAPVTGDPDDDLILACAVRGQVDLLVSGDHRHLLPVGVYEGVRIVTAQTLLAELSSM
jgi:putative PIN family toxin of toxin-antitoxin system